MCRYPSSTIHRYLDLPSTQRIQTHTSHRHNTTPPLPTHVQAPYPLPTYTTATKTQTHVQHSTCPQRIGKAQTQFSHPLTPRSTHTARAKHIHMSHTPPTPLTSTSPVLDKTPEPRVPLIHTLTATTPHPDPTPALPSPSHPHTLTAHTHATQTTVHASQLPQQPHAQHRVLRQPHKQTKDYHRTTNTTQTHRPSSKSERNLIILQVNINGLRNKLEELKLLIHDTHADIITILETKLIPNAKTPKIHNFTSVRTDRLHKAGGGLIRDNITFTTTDIPSTINTHNIELQMVKVHINNTKHITIANIYIPPRDTTSTNIPHSVLTGDVNAHSTLWHSYTDGYRIKLIADVISNVDHITLNTNSPTRVSNTTLQQTYSPDITTVSNTLYNRTSWTTQHALASDHLPIITTINIRHDYRLQQNRRTFTNYKKTNWTQFTKDTESTFAQTTIPTNIHTANRIFTNIILTRRENTCDPALKLLNEEITSDIQKHKQNICKEHLDAHWDHRHNTHTLWKTIHGLSNRAPPHTHTHP